MNQELKNKYLKFVTKINTSSSKNLEAFSKEVYKNYSLGELQVLRSEMVVEIGKVTAELNKKLTNCLSKLKENHTNELVKQLQELTEKIEYQNFRLKVLDTLVDNYKELRYITLPNDIHVREYDIRTPKGNKARKPRLLEKGKKLLCIEEFLSTNPFRHGMYYKLMDESDGYVYFVYTKDAEQVKEVVDENTNIKEWYMSTYITDVLGKSIRGNITFLDAFVCLDLFKDFYRFLGVNDSVVRERVFQQLAKVMGCSYDYIYNQWLYSKGS